MTLRGTLIGCGFFAANHLSAWKSIPGVEIVAVCDHEPDKVQSAAARFQVSRHYTDAADMLREQKPDFVDIVTTVDSHRQLVELAASYAVPVICQKPFATNLEDAAAMVIACNHAGVPLMIHENFRWQRPLMEIENILVSGAIGRPFFGRISFRHDFNVYEKQPYLAEVDRFAILDVGIHLLDVARFYFGEVKHLGCTVQRANPRVKGEDVATILLEHENGATSLVDCSFYSHIVPNPFPQTLVEIDGTSGSIRLGADYLLSVTSGGRAMTRNVDAAVLPWMERPWHVVQDSVLNIQKHWVDCLSRGLTPMNSGADNLRTLKLGLAAYDAAENGSTIRFD